MSEEKHDPPAEAPSSTSTSESVGSNNHLNGGEKVVHVGEQQSDDSKKKKLRPAREATFKDYLVRLPLSLTQPPTTQSSHHPSDILTARLHLCHEMGLFGLRRRHHSRYWRRRNSAAHERHHGYVLLSVLIVLEWAI
jgi:hypothetical protein